MKRAQAFVVGSEVQNHMEDDLHMVRRRNARSERCCTKGASKDLMDNHFEDVLEMVKKIFSNGNYRKILGSCRSIQGRHQS